MEDQDFNFDADAHVDESRETIEPGSYTLRVVEASFVATKAGNGRMIKLAYEILGPRFSGRWVWDQIVVDHPNADAVRIGLGKLSELSRALRTPKWKRPSELIGQTCDAKIVVTNDPGFGEKNEIKKYVVPAAMKGAPSANPAKVAAQGGKHTERTFQASPPEAYDDDVPF